MRGESLTPTVSVWIPGARLNDPGVETDVYMPPQCIAQFSSGHLRLFPPTGVLRESLSGCGYLARSSETRQVMRCYHGQICTERWLDKYSVKNLGGVNEGRKKVLVCVVETSQ